MIEKFREQYKAEKGNTIVSDELIKNYEKKVPSLLIDIWKTTGFGKYNKGLIEIIDPNHYENYLLTWLGKEVENCTPFAITGFWELLYYRKLTETEEDICIIDLQYRRIETLMSDVDWFLNEVLTDKDFRRAWLREALFLKAIKKKAVC